jgi:hypothetical protein
MNGKAKANSTPTSNVLGLYEQQCSEIMPLHYKAQRIEVKIQACLLDSTHRRKGHSSLRVYSKPQRIVYWMEHTRLTNRQVLSPTDIPGIGQIKAGFRNC